MSLQPFTLASKNVSPEISRQAIRPKSIVLSPFSSAAAPLLP